MIFNKPRRESNLRDHHHLDVENGSQNRGAPRKMKLLRIKDVMFKFWRLDTIWPVLFWTIIYQVKLQMKHFLTKWKSDIYEDFVSEWNGKILNATTCSHCTSHEIYRPFCLDFVFMNSNSKIIYLTKITSMYQQDIINIQKMTLIVGRLLLWYNIYRFRESHPVSTNRQCHNCHSV